MSSSERPRAAARRLNGKALSRAALSWWLLCGIALVLAAAAASVAGAAGLDLRALQVLPQHGQSADQARRDRYECHLWAVDQTGVIPSAEPTEDKGDNESRARGERIGRIVNATILGAGLGGLIRAVEHRDPDGGVLAGAAIGAAVSAAKTRPREHAKRSELDSGSQDYLRALSACLEGRGYKVVVPGRKSAGKNGAAAHNPT